MEIKLLPKTDMLVSAAILNFNPKMEIKSLPKTEIFFYPIKMRAFVYAANMQNIQNYARFRTQSQGRA